MDKGKKDNANCREPEKSQFNSLAMYRAIFENSRDAIGVLKAGIHLFVNHAYRDLFGLPPGSDLVGKPVLDLIAPASRAQSKDYIQRQAQGEMISFNYETRGLRADGKEFDMEVSVSVYQEQGEDNTLVILREITERKRVAALLKSQFENSPDIILIIDQNLKIEAINRIAAGNFTVEGLKGKDSIEILPPEHRDFVRQAIARCFETCEIQEFEHGIGDGKWVRARVVPMAVDHTISRAMIISTDITEQKQAEEALRQTNQLFSLFMIHSPIYTYIKEVTPTQSRVLYASENFQKMIGIPGSEMVGKTMEELFPPEFAAKITVDDWAVVSGGCLFTADEDLHGRNFTTIKSPLVQGDKTLLVGYTLDITERKQAEAALRGIIDSIPVGMHTYHLEPDGRLVFTGANPAADRILGVDNSIFIGKTIEEAFPSLKDTEVPQCYRKAAATGKAWFTEQIEYDEGAIKGAFEVHAFQTAPNTIAVAFEDISMRKRSELVLKQSENKYRRLYNETPVLLHSIDMDGIIVEVNNHWLRTMGYDRDEVIGKKITDFYTDASRKHFLEVVRPAFLRDGIAKDISYQFIRKNGKLVDVLLSATAERDTDGNVVRSQAVIVDITEQKRAEELLLQREAKYRLLYEGTPVMLHSIDAEGTLVSVSDHWLSTLGYTRDEVLGRRSTEFLNDESRIYARDVVLPDFMRTGICNDIPYTFIKKNGERISTLLSAIAERDEAGKVVRSLAVIIDITEQKRTEDALRESEAKFRGLVEESPLAILIIARSGRIEYINKKHYELLGYTVEQIPTLDAWWKLVYPDAETRHRTVAAWGDLTRKIYSGENVGPIERTIACKDGTSKDVEMRFSLAGEKIYVVFVDVTERKKLEQELIKTQKLESVGTLAGGIAHDFNNLLQGIFGYIALAKMTIEQKDKALAMLDQAEKALHQSVNLTTQLLTFSKGGKPLKKVFSLRPMIEDAVTFSLSGSSVDHILLVDENLRPIDADEGQLGQVIQNIVLNAEQAMPLGGRIEIGARNIAAATVAGLPDDLRGDLLEITVRDHGTGIPPEHLPRIFDPYFTTKERGSGLGLATVYSIIKNHGGMIQVSSELGKGSTFTIYLPVSGAAEEQANICQGIAEGRKGRILVMDDEKFVREVAGALINSLGHEVALSEHGESAIMQYRAAMAAGRPFDLVVLDLTIKGGMGGLETLQKLLEIDPGVKAVVSSGYSDDASMSEYQAKGFKAFLKKPYRVQNLSSLLNDLMA